MSSQPYLHSISERISKIEKKIGCSNVGGSSSNGCLREEECCMNVYKDLVTRCNVVISKCEPNKLVATNEHKQLQSINLQQLIKGTVNQIDISATNTGIKINCPQDLDEMATPTFKSLKLLSKPINNNEVVTKEYVDSAVATGSKTDLNLCKRLDVINPDGECLRLGRDGGTFIDIKVDANGTLNLSNNAEYEINDIDIYGERINLLSNIDSTSPNTGSLVLYGGMGIMKDLQLGGGLYLQNDAGIPSKLDFFEEGAMQIIWGGIWNSPIDSSFVYQRIGGSVNLMIPYIGSRAYINNVITNTPATYLPERLRPLYDIKKKIRIIDNDNELSGWITIYGDDGRIVIKPKLISKFSGVGISGFHTLSLNYMVDTKK